MFALFPYGLYKERDPISLTLREYMANKSFPISFEMVELLSLKRNIDQQGNIPGITY